MLVVTKEVFGRLTVADQEAVRRAAAELGEQMHRSNAAAAAEARRVLEQLGIQFVELPPDRMASLRTAAEATWKEHAKSPAAKQLLEKVLAARAERLE